MIKEFKIFEKLGYNEEVAKLTEHVWNLYKRGEKEIDLSDYSKKNMTIYINKLFIEEYNDQNSNTRMSALYNSKRYKKNKNFKITINKSSRPTMMSLEHEIKHMYDFIKRGGALDRMKDKRHIGPFSSMSSSVDEIDIFLYIMYLIEYNEIEAYYHSDIRNFKENRHKFKNDIKHYIKYSRLKSNLEYIKWYDVKKLVSKISLENKNEILNIYYDVIKITEISNLEGFKYRFEIFKSKIRNFLNYFNIKVYSEREINNFFNYFIKEVERKKKVYIRYINRLYSYFNEN